MEGRQRDTNEEVRGPMEEELKMEEFRRAIKSLKVRKAAGVDGIHGSLEICGQGTRRRNDRLNKNNLAARNDALRLEKEHSSAVV